MTGLLDPTTLLPLIAALALAGALIGFLAGLFGIGGGAISVPVFYEVFQTLGHAPDVAKPLVVGASLALIIPTSIQSARGHFKRGTVNMGLLRTWALPVMDRHSGHFRLHGRGLWPHRPAAGRDLALCG